MRTTGVSGCRALTERRRSSPLDAGSRMSVRTRSKGCSATSSSPSSAVVVAETRQFSGAITSRRKSSTSGSSSTTRTRKGTPAVGPASITRGTGKDAAPRSRRRVPSPRGRSRVGSRRRVRAGDGRRLARRRAAEPLVEGRFVEAPLPAHLLARQVAAAGEPVHGRDGQLQVGGDVLNGQDLDAPTSPPLGDAAVPPPSCRSSHPGVRFATAVPPSRRRKNARTGAISGGQRRTRSVTRGLPRGCHEQRRDRPPGLARK